MKFICKYNDRIVQGKLVYYETGEFAFFPSKNADIIILLDYLCLGFNSEHMIARQVWGLHPCKNWIRKHLQHPNASKGELYLDTNVEPGSVIRLEGIGNITYYDEQSGWICIGSPFCKDCEKIEFATNTIVAIEHNKLQSLWLKPEFEKSI